MTVLRNLSKKKVYASVTKYQTSCALSVLTYEPSCVLWKIVQMFAEVNGQ